MSKETETKSYDDNVKIWKRAYTEIKDVCEKYAIEFNNKYGLHDVADMLRTAESHLRKIEYYEEYGIKLTDPVTSTEWTRIDDYRHIGFYDGESRSVSWPDDGKQPKNERLYTISFSTGAYMFGDDYPTELFQEFFQELKSYKPKYIDSANKSLLFTLDNAKGIHDNFRGILDKYHKKNREDADKRRIKKLKAELDKLESKQ